MLLFFMMRGVGGVQSHFRHFVVVVIAKMQWTYVTRTVESQSTASIEALIFSAVHGDISWYCFVLYVPGS